jgi:hypothetical protein
MENKYNFYKAYDNQSKSGRIVVNYELKTRTDNDSLYEYVDRVFVWYNGESVVVDMWNFELMGDDGVVRERILKDGLTVEKLNSDGVTQIHLVVESNENKFVMLFNKRDKSFRILENSFEERTASGAMHTSRRVELPKLGFIQGEV